MATNFYIATRKQTDSIDTGVTAKGFGYYSFQLHRPVSTSLLNDDDKI